MTPATSSATRASSESIWTGSWKISKRHAGAARVAEDVDSADLSNVSGTPTFFVNGRRHYGAYDIDTLTQVVRVARARATSPRRLRQMIGARGCCARMSVSRWFAAVDGIIRYSTKS